MTLDKSSSTPSAVQTSQKLHQQDIDLIEKHHDYILRLANSDDDPVSISLYLQQHDIHIRVSSLRSFLMNCSFTSTQN